MLAIAVVQFMASGHRPCVDQHSPFNVRAPSNPTKDMDDLKPELQELVTLMRKTLRTVCDELRRIHKGNKLLEEQHRALAGQLADCEVKRSLQASQAQHSANIASLNRPQAPSLSPDVTQSLPKPVTRPLPKKSALAGPKSDVHASSPEAQNDGKESRKPSERRLTLRLSKNLLRKLSSASGVEVDESDDSGSEIFEANNPEEVLEMQNLLIKLSARHRSENEKRDRQDSVASQQEDFEEKRVTRHDSVATSRCYEEEPETSPTTRASQSRRLAPGLAEEVSRGESLPPRRFTIFSKR